MAKPMSAFFALGSVPERRCAPPKPFFFSPDFASSILYWDELGQPKKFTVSQRLPNGEWSYRKNHINEALTGNDLKAHFAAIEDLKRSIREGREML